MDRTSTHHFAMTFFDLLLSQMYVPIEHRGSDHRATIFYEGGRITDGPVIFRY